MRLLFLFGTIFLPRDVFTSAFQCNTPATTAGRRRRIQSTTIATMAFGDYLSNLGGEALSKTKTSKPTPKATTGGIPGNYLSSLSGEKQEQPDQPKVSFVTATDGEKASSAATVSKEPTPISLQQKSKSTPVLKAETRPATAKLPSQFLTDVMPSFFFTGDPKGKPGSSVPILLEDEKVVFSHATYSHFAINKLTPEGPRKNADVGSPHDAALELVEIGPTSVGSWWCSEGGWPLPAQRKTTETFYVFSGRGCVTDMDGRRHFFGPGDTVILPKGWSGRWDILEAVHKLFFVHDHPKIEETSDPIRAAVTPYSRLVASKSLVKQGQHSDATHGSPSTASYTIYNKGPIEVGSWACSPGSFPILNLGQTECFHVLEGLFFIANADGTAQRCESGDTVVLPKGWTGHWHVIEPVRKLWMVGH